MFWISKNLVSLKFKLFHFDFWDLTALEDGSPQSGDRNSTMVTNFQGFPRCHPSFVFSTWIYGKAKMILRFSATGHMEVFVGWEHHRTFSSEKKHVDVPHRQQWIIPESNGHIPWRIRIRMLYNILVVTFTMKKNTSFKLASVSTINRWIRHMGRW